MRPFRMVKRIQMIHCSFSLGQDPSGTDSWGAAVVDELTNTRSSLRDVCEESEAGGLV
jgi:hypothetical protein